MERGATMKAKPSEVHKIQEEQTAAGKNLALVEQKQKIARSGTLATKKKVKMIDKGSKDDQMSHYRTQKTMDLGSSLQKSKTSVRK